jgi:hypothetical protein
LIWPNQVQWSKHASIEGYSRFWSDSSIMETFADTITIPKDVVDRTALGTIAERVSHPTSSRSYCSCPHLESLYITSLREFLASINRSIVTEHPYTIPLQRVHDRAIMDVVITSNLFTPMECKIINYCRMFLRVHSIADLTLAGRKHIDASFLALDPLLLSSASTLIKPLQDRPQTALALRLWQCANRLWCNTVTGGLHQPLGNGWFQVHSSVGVGPFILIQILNHCGVGLERDLVFILVLKLVAT